MRPWLCVVVVLASLGCPGAGQQDLIPAPYTPSDDVAFIDAMVPHHETAVWMADQVIVRGADADVREMAVRMLAAQEFEIEALLGRREALTSAPVQPVADDPHMQDAMVELGALAGDALDRAFLAEMIPHHATALVTAHRARPNLADDDVIGIADLIERDQAREIGDMRAKLDAMQGLASP
ncbi:MAG: DUF305 domain-containing protein [Myxococcota bacterium]